mmetsp:Transcript_12384/g.34781  ORF Transcript_12384/g.34781 Transcript_12384/m.34781 type:complete len:214 (+) Transcript_12384:110-751(+)
MAALVCTRPALLVVASHDLSELGLKPLLPLLVGDLLGLPGLGVTGLGAGLLLSHGVLTDLIVHLLESILHGVVGELRRVVGGEVGIKLVGRLLLHLLHVLANVTVEDVLLQHLGVELLLLRLEAHKALFVVGDLQAAIQHALQGTEDTRAGGGAHKTGVKHTVEGAGALIVGLHCVHLSVSLLLAGVRLSQAKLGKHAAGQQQAGRVGSCVVL